MAGPSSTDEELEIGTSVSVFVPNTKSERPSETKLPSIVSGGAPGVSCV